MKPENEALSLVIDRFPRHAEHIETLFNSNEHFHELCMDYQLCIQHLKQFIQNEEKAGIHEYENLLKDLENELAHFLSRHKASSDLKSFAGMPDGKSIV
jgi:hypothetical protein